MGVCTKKLMFFSAISQVSHLKVFEWLYLFRLDALSLNAFDNFIGGFVLYVIHLKFVIWKSNVG